MAETAFGTAYTIDATAIGKVKSISGGGQTLTMIETGNMDSDTATNLAGLLRGQPATLTIEYEKTAATGNYALCLAESEGRVAGVHLLTFTDTSTIQCTGFMTNVSNPEGETESELTFTVEITPQTVWTHTGVA